MLVLAIDTCFGACSTAVFHHAAGAPISGPLAAIDEAMAVGHAERLMPMIAEVMAASKLSFADLDAIAVTVGPGTFTGVRTGIAAARGLSLAARMPVLGITSLELIARRFDIESVSRMSGSRLAVCMEAGKGQIYAQIFDSAAVGRVEPSEPMLTTVDDVVMRLSLPFAGGVVSYDGVSTVVGSAARVVRESAAHRNITAILPVNGEVAVHQPSARFMQNCRLQPMSPPTPLYLRPPDAVPQADKALPRAHS